MYCAYIQNVETIEIIKEQVRILVKEKDFKLQKEDKEGTKSKLLYIF